MDTTPDKSPRQPRPRSFAVCAASALAVAAAFACSNIEKADPTVQTKRADPISFEIDADPIMRGTVAAETMVVGYEPNVVRAYGVVVGLKGTGSRIAPNEVRQHMIQDLARRGVGDPTVAEVNFTPETLLDSEDTAIVVVEGVVSPGATKGTKFDLRIYAAPGTATTSLEGGKLWTCDLRPGLLIAGSKQARPLAEGRGPVVVNPFADQSGKIVDTVNRLSGRILNGGEVTRDMSVKLRLSTPSHARARLIANAINSYFPRERGQKDDTARGRSSELIDIHVPPSWRSRTDEFVQVLRHTPITTSPIEQLSSQVARSVTNNPGAASAASLRWQALGKKSLGAVRPLYTFPEEQPRFAALDAGAKLDDAIAVPHLLDLARNGSGKVRVQAVRLLGRMSSNPSVDLGLRSLLDDDDIDVRLTAFEELRDRNDPIVQSQDVGGRFRVDVVPSAKPMIYVSQSGEPRIAIFGTDLEVVRPMTMTAWSGRLMFKGDEGKKSLEVFYRPGDGMPPVTDFVQPKMAEVARFLGHTTTVDRPAPGLGMTYSETIGALHELWKLGYVKADFKAEQDRILASIVKADEDKPRDARPEYEDEETEAEMPSEGNIRPTIAADPLKPAAALDAQAPRRDTVPR